MPSLAGTVRLGHGAALACRNECLKSERSLSIDSILLNAFQRIEHTSYIRYTEVRMKLGAILRKNRRAKGLTQPEVASRAGVRLATLQNIESDKGNPTLDTIEAILDCLGPSLATKEMRPAVQWHEFLDSLCTYGLPIMQQHSAEPRGHSPPRPQTLLQMMNMNSPKSFKKKLEGRELEALVSFAAAIADHYPSTWQLIRPEWNEFLTHRRSIVRPKLRRLALQSLARYL